MIFHYIIKIYKNKCSTESFKGVIKKFNTNVRFRHYTLNQIYNELDDKDLQNYTIFTVLRNPLKKIVSTYNHTKTHKNIVPMSFNTYIKFLFMYFLKKISEKESQSYLKFNNVNVIDKRHIEKLNFWIDIPDLVKLNDLKLNITDKYFTLFNNKVKIYLLRFNHLNLDFKHFSKIINVKPNLSHYNVNPITKSKKSTYMSYYNNIPGVKKKLQDIYSKELSILHNLLN